MLTECGRTKNGKAHLLKSTFQPFLSFWNIDWLLNSQTFSCGNTFANEILDMFGVIDFFLILANDLTQMDQFKTTTILHMKNNDWKVFLFSCETSRQKEPKICSVIFWKLFYTEKCNCWKNDCMCEFNTIQCSMNRRSAVMLKEPNHLLFIWNFSVSYQCLAKHFLTICFFHFAIQH